MKRLLLLMSMLLFVTAGISAKENIKFDKEKYGVSAGESVTLEYTLSREGKVTVMASDGWKAAVEANGGSICVERREPEGTRFVLRFPLLEKKEEDA